MPTDDDDFPRSYRWQDEAWRLHQAIPDVDVERMWERNSRPESVVRLLLGYPPLEPDGWPRRFRPFPIVDVIEDWWERQRIRWRRLRTAW